MQYLQISKKDWQEQVDGKEIYIQIILYNTIYNYIFIEVANKSKKIYIIL